METYSYFDLPKIFGKPLKEVDEIISDMESHIHQIKIPKKDGSPRIVSAPDQPLKYIQKSIYWRLLKLYRPHDAAHGFVAKRGISTNADRHVGAMSVGKIDIKSFFDSVSVENHMNNILFGNKNVCRKCKHYERMLDGKCHPSLYKNSSEDFENKCEEIKAVVIPNFCEETGYQSLFKRIIAICTYNGFTAQGFPTSPVIANLSLRGFDKTISEYCKENEIEYTRYADDLAFSSKKLGKQELRDMTMKVAYKYLRAYHFQPNLKKTIYKSRSGRLKICGVVVNVRKNIPRKALDLFRAKVHHAITMYPEKTTKTRMRELIGYCSFLMSINPNKAAPYMKRLLDFKKKKFKTKEQKALA